MKILLIFIFAFVSVENAIAQKPVNDVQLDQIASLSKPGNYDKYPSIAVDSQNTTWVSYTSMRADKEKIILASKHNNQWNSEIQIDNGQEVESNSKLLFSSKGVLWVFWQGKRNGKWGVYAKYRRNNEWSDEQKLTADAENCFRPNVVEDSRGNLWLVYEKVSKNKIDLELSVFENNTWSKPIAVTNSGINRRASLAADKFGKVWIAYDSPVSGNYDIWLTSAVKERGQQVKINPPIQATKSLGIDDSPSIACADDGTLWLAWNSLRSLQKESNRSNRHAGAIFLKAYRNGKWFVTEKVSKDLMLGEVSYRNIDKSTNDAEDEYWHWKQTQSLPTLYFDAQKRLWVVWRTDMYGAHNFDLWSRVYNGRAWSDLLQLTTFSPGRDEFPAFSVNKQGALLMAWEAQTLPVKGEEEKLMGGFVDSYNTNGNNNVVVFGEIKNVNYNWHPSALRQTDIETTDQAIDLEKPLTATGAAGKISADKNLKIYFGDPHSHTVLSDGKYGWADQIIYLSKEKLAIDFTVISDHAEMGRLQNSEYAELALMADNFSEDGKYIDFLGFEWTAQPAYGHRIVIYPNTTSPNVSAALADGNSTRKLYDFIKPFGGIVSAHHTGQAEWGRWNPLAEYDSELEPNFEIVSFHGRFEYYKNPLEGRRQVPGHQYQDALKQGRRSGVMGASDTHFLSPGEGGLTAVLAESLTRENIFSAIEKRRTYATTGVKILLDFSINNNVMGSEISIAPQEPVKIHLAVTGTAPIDHIEIVKNTDDYFAVIRIKQIPGTQKGTYMIYDPASPQGGRRIETDNLSEINLDLDEKAKPGKETSYYVRVTQTDGNQAWSSPIWLKLK